MKNLELKSFYVNFTFDEVKGIFKGYASAFNGVDLVNDKILPGAYDEEISKFTEGKKTRVNYEHDKSIVLAEYLDNIMVDDNGLLVEWSFSEEAKQLYPDIWNWAVKKAQEGGLSMSIGFEVLDSLLGEERHILKKERKAYDEIKKLALDHIAITENPVDRKAVVLEVKSNEPNLNIELKSISGKVSAKKFLKENKSILSNNNIENFIDHVYNLAHKPLKDKETELKSQCETIAPVVESKNQDFNSILDEVILKIK
jgi:HK97 family phage prohead protease